MPILNPDFDPDWKARFERAQRRVDATGKPEHLPAMQNAFWSRYRTMAEIRDFHSMPCGGKRMHGASM
jgi:hypothetical protein